MRITLRQLLLGIAALAGAGFLVAWAGIINIGASSGHWRITEWALHWAMQNYTRTYALLEPEPPPELDAPARVRRGAGHFETSCAFCHGSPVRPTPDLGRHMTPQPPGLKFTARKWDAPELSRIVKHGIKYTGMPAWIAPQRDDEVWAMVAFLRAQGAMSPEDYRAAAFGPPVPEDPVLEGCARCHGVDGGSQGGAFPVLAGQSEAYLVATLRAFAQDRRHSGYMQFAVDALPEEELARMARYYASRPGLREKASSDGSRGAEIALRGIPEAGVPACESCHGASPRRNLAYPHLAGQDAGYIADQLRLMKKRARGGTAYGPVMQRIAGRLPDDAIDTVAAYYSAAGAGAAAK